jgi:hypothetical protein
MENLAKISATCCKQINSQHIIGLETLFGDDDALDAKNLYISYFGRIPNWITLDDIKGKEANEWFSQTYKNDTTDCCYTRRYEKKKGIYFDDVYYFLFEDLLVYVNTNGGKIKLFYRKTDIFLIDKIIDEIRKFRFFRLIRGSDSCPKIRCNDVSVISFFPKIQQKNEFIYLLIK